MVVLRSDDEETNLYTMRASGGGRRWVGRGTHLLTAFQLNLTPSVKVLLKGNLARKQWVQTQRGSSNSFSEKKIGSLYGSTYTYFKVHTEICSPVYFTDLSDHYIFTLCLLYNSRKRQGCSLLVKLPPVDLPAHPLHSYTVTALSA